MHAPKQAYDSKRLFENRQRFRLNNLTSLIRARDSLGPISAMNALAQCSQYSLRAIKDISFFRHIRQLERNQDLLKPVTKNDCKWMPIPSISKKLMKHEPIIRPILESQRVNT